MALVVNFSKSDIEVKTVDNQLTIKSIESETKDEKKLYIEIFQKENLVEHLLWQMISKLINAELKDVMLLIDLEKIVPE